MPIPADKRSARFIRKETPVKVNHAQSIIEIAGGAVMLCAIIYVIASRKMWGF
ncbi:MAG TPA: hypothetical protein VKA70_02565 [Blastocatellia bacterium]|nr:hypothetical protein [Blastocatellia bacterium]